MPRTHPYIRPHASTRKRKHKKMPLGYARKAFLSLQFIHTKSKKGYYINQNQITRKNTPHHAVRHLLKILQVLKARFQHTLFNLMDNLHHAIVGRRGTTHLATKIRHRPIYSIHLGELAFFKVLQHTRF